jgi:NitT/TauT family transport system permease protein
MESPRPAPKFWGLHADPQGNFQRLLNLLPFLMLLGIYLTASHLRLSENPQDKLLPSLGQMWDALTLMAFTPDKRTGEYLMFTDTGSSLLRLGAGVGAAAASGLMLGLFTGLFRGLNALISPFLTFIAIIPPLSILPILFIVFGVDEFAKIMLIFIGTFPVITRDIFTATRAFPQELITKGLTLGASDLQVAFKILLPQLLPRLFENIRLTLGGAWLFLIAAEAIASTSGLGYRIFLVRRYLAMDIIIPYVLWITCLGFSLDWLLKTLVARRFKWYQR